MGDQRRSSSKANVDISKSAELKAVTLMQGLNSDYSSSSAKGTSADFYMQRIHQMIEKEQRVKTHNYELREQIKKLEAELVLERRTHAQTSSAT